MKFICFFEHMDFTNFCFFSDWASVEKWIKLNGIRQNRNAALAGRLIHEAPDGRRAFIIEGTLRGLSARRPVQLLGYPGPLVPFVPFVPFDKPKKDEEPWDLNNL